MDTRLPPQGSWVLCAHSVVRPIVVLLCRRHGKGKRRKALPNWQSGLPLKQSQQHLLAPPQHTRAPRFPLMLIHCWLSQTIPSDPSLSNKWWLLTWQAVMVMPSISSSRPFASFHAYSSLWLWPLITLQASSDSIAKIWSGDSFGTMDRAFSIDHKTVYPILPVFLSGNTISHYGQVKLCQSRYCRKSASSVSLTA